MLLLVATHKLLRKASIAHTVRERLELERWVFNRKDIAAVEPNAYEQAIVMPSPRASVTFAAQ
jgi:hypothetical protein